LATTTQQHATTSGKLFHKEGASDSHLHIDFSAEIILHCITTTTGDSERGQWPISTNDID